MALTNSCQKIWYATDAFTATLANFWPFMQHY